MQLTCKAKSLALAIAFASAPVAAAPFSQIIAFGDSLTDAGQFPDAEALENGVYQNYRATNRGSNGLREKVAIQRLSESLGLGPLYASAPRLPSIATGDPIGTDYAVAGYKTDEILYSITGEDCILQATLTRDGYLIANPKADKNALYYINGGGNNLIGAAMQTLASSETSVSDHYTTASADELIQGANALDKAGAQYIMVSNLPDLGKSPYAARLDSKQPGIAGQLTNAVDDFNNTLYQSINASAANIITVDQFGLMQEILASPAEFGFANNLSGVLSTTCYDDEDKTRPSCIENTVYGISNPTTGDPSKLLFNDAVHPTAAAHQVISDYMLSILNAGSEIGLLPQMGHGITSNTLDTISQQLAFSRSSKENPWYIFATGAALDNNYASGGNTPSTDGDEDAAMLGASYRLSNRWLLGAAINTQYSDLDTYYNSHFEVDSIGFSGFFRYQHSRHKIGVEANYNDLDYGKIQRSVMLGQNLRYHEGDTDGRSYGVGANYAFTLHSKRKLSYGPTLSLQYQYTKVDGYSEGGEIMSTSLSFDDQDYTSLVIGAGVYIKWASSNDKLTVGTELKVRREINDDDSHVDVALQSLATKSFELPGYEQTSRVWSEGNIAASYLITESISANTGFHYSDGEQEVRRVHVGIGATF